jgi:hypothetical protein
MADQEHRQPALERIEQQGGQRRALVARAQHVGGTGIAAAVAARIGHAERFAHDDREGQRADQVRGHDGKEGWQMKAQGGAPRRMDVLIR